MNGPCISLTTSSCVVCIELVWSAEAFPLSWSIAVGPGLFWFATSTLTSGTTEAFTCRHVPLTGFAVVKIIIQLQ